MRPCPPVEIPAAPALRVTEPEGLASVVTAAVVMMPLAAPCALRTRSLLAAVMLLLTVILPVVLTKLKVPPAALLPVSVVVSPLLKYTSLLAPAPLPAEAVILLANKLTGNPLAPIAELPAVALFVDRLTAPLLELRVKPPASVMPPEPNPFTVIVNVPVPELLVIVEPNMTLLEIPELTVFVKLRLPCKPEEISVTGPAAVALFVMVALPPNASNVIALAEVSTAPFPPPPMVPAVFASINETAPLAPEAVSWLPGLAISILPLAPPVVLIEIAEFAVLLVIEPSEMLPPAVFVKVRPAPSAGTVRLTGRPPALEIWIEPAPVVLAEIIAAFFVLTPFVPPIEPPPVELRVIPAVVCKMPLPLPVESMPPLPAVTEMAPWAVTALVPFPLKLMP